MTLLTIRTLPHRLNRTAIRVLPGQHFTHPRPRPLSPRNKRPYRILCQPECPYRKKRHGFGPFGNNFQQGREAVACDEGTRTSSSAPAPERAPIAPAQKAGFFLHRCSCQLYIVYIYCVYQTYTV